MVARGVRGSFALWLTAVGCSDDDTSAANVVEVPAAGDDTAAPTARHTFLPPEIQAKQEALRGISACLRRTAPRVDRSWERYRAGINPESGRPARRTEVEPFIHRLELDLAPCRALPPEGSAAVDADTNAAAKTYVAALTQYAALTERLAPYYDEKAYKDDGWALGEELAPQLADAHRQWADAASVLTPTLKAARDQADDEALAALATTDAPLAQSLTITVGRQAREVRACFTPQDIDPAECRTRLQTFSEALAAVTALLDGGDERDDAPYVFWLEALQRTAQRLQGQAQASLDARQPKPGRPRFTDRDRELVLDAARHVEDVADNVRFGI